MVLLEDSFVANDPFTPEARPLCLGGKCAICSACVCVTCSLYYTKRVCGKCAREVRGAMPVEMHAVIDRLPGGAPAAQPPR
mmetsp:Transcript_19180/g.44228  ORF Transcript_19180/g.44228 Transcript_19180/m.44228 type:complete len:81 (-) Transcript_19180:103-345(-)